MNLQEKVSTEDYKITDYAGNIMYETTKNSTVTTNKTRILVDGGYYEGGVYYFYINDHLGNNRIVANAAASVTEYAVLSIRDAVCRCDRAECSTI